MSSITVALLALLLVALSVVEEVGEATFCDTKRHTKRLTCSHSDLSELERFTALGGRRCPAIGTAEGICEA